MTNLPLHKFRSGFTLVELLVVIAIIGLLAGIAIPSMKGLGVDKINAAATQLADDLAFARHKAIANRTTIYVVFISPTIVRERWNELNVDQRKQLDNLINGQYTAYSVFARRSLGDQPGPGTARYLTEWQRLPEGVFITTNEFARLTEQAWANTAPTNRPFYYGERIKIPFPTADSPLVSLPYIAFNYQGQLVHQINSKSPGDEYVYFSAGAISFPRDAQKRIILADADVRENPKSNWVTNPYIRVDWLTGRPRVEHRPVL